MYTQVDLETLFNELQDAGLHPMLCDQVIPHFDNPVMCGNPTDVGDIIQKGYNIPSSVFGKAVCYSIIAHGDSMKDAQIYDGDRLTIMTDCEVRDGQIVLASIDNEYTVKSYWEDENGDKWLVPFNEKYKAIPLSDKENCFICGRVVEVARVDPVTSFRDCERIVRMTKAAIGLQKDIERERWEEVIRTISKDITFKRLWFAVYKQFVVFKIIAKGDYATFCQEVKRVVPEHPKLPTTQEVQRMDVMSFAKTVKLWDIDDAPVKGTRFYVYLNMTKRVAEMLSR